MEHLKNCPICEGDIFSLFLTCKDYTASKEEFSLVRCNSCSFIFTNPRPDIRNIGKYYNVENYVSHSGTSKGLINKLYHFARRLTLANKLKLINRLSVQKNLLDIGCGTGNFLAYALQNGWNITGVEPDERTRLEANRICSNKVFDEEKLNQLPKESFDIITLWHVLEHVYKLEERLNQLNKLLKPNGKLIIAVPNCDSYDAHYYKKFWGAYDVPRHLYHFNPLNIKQLFEQQGFTLEKVLPMPIDSFYVSMLSEKYKNGFVPRGILIGLLSNLKAISKKETWSSQIYIISKKQPLFV